LVTCCKKCNGLKGWRTLEQSGMKLLNKPKAPQLTFKTALKQYRDSDYEEWDFYLQQ
jgi:5-methylcytosine-specific restriction endonuclease McrA